MKKNTVSSVLNAISIITWIVGFIGGIVALISEDSAVMMIAMWLSAFLFGVVFMAAAEIISLLTAILRK